MEFNAKLSAIPADGGRAKFNVEPGCPTPQLVLLNANAKQLGDLSVGSWYRVRIEPLDPKGATDGETIAAADVAEIDSTLLGA